MQHMNMEDFLTFTNSVPLSSERPFDHVALAIALQDKGVPAQAHMFKVVLKDNMGNQDTTPGMAIEISGSVVTIDGHLSWPDIEKHESDFSDILFEEVTGKKAVSSTFTHQAITQEKLDRARLDPIIMDTVATIAPKLTQEIVKSLSEGIFEQQDQDPAILPTP